MKNSEIYQMVTDRIVAKMEEGIIAWRKPWTSVLPMNYVTKKAYQGINFFICSFNSFTSPYYMSFKQIKEKGGNVKRGEKGTPIVFWQFMNKEIKNERTGELETKTFPLLKYYTVFNMEQCENLEIEAPTEVNNIIGKIETLEALLNNMPSKPNVKEGGHQAYYSPTFDYIQMPPKQYFESTAGYYKTLSHETIHSTGHSSRLKRAGVTGNSFFGSHDYSFEELIAEMGAAYLCAIGGISTETTDNSVAYLQSWIKAFKNDNTMLMKAAAQAQKAVDYIQGKFVEKEATKEEAEGTIELKAMAA